MLIRRDQVMSRNQHLEAVHSMQTSLSATSAVSPPGSTLASLAATATSVTSATPASSLPSPGSDASTATIPRVVPTAEPKDFAQVLNPLQQWEALQRQSLNADKKQLVDKASGNAGPYGTYVAHNILHV